MHSGRRLAAAAIVGGGLLALGLAQTFPVLAETGGAPGVTEVETPFGRAPLSFADIVEKVKPSVVSISVVSGSDRKVAGGRRGRGNPFENLPDLPEDHPLHDFFKNLPKQFGGPPQPEAPRQAQGSGFVISPDGYVVTNNHVIDNSSKIQVSFDDQEKLDADLIGTDPRTDIALLKIKSNGKTFPYVSFASTKPRVGDWVLAVGNPFGLGGTVTAGIVSALARDIGSGPYDYMQIDAAVNRGNSGGPAFNLRGEVVGVNTAIFSPSGGNVGIAFAVPAETVQAVVRDLKESGTVSRGWLGVKIQNVDEDTAASLGLREQKGALVSEVTPGGPAAAAGIKVQDTILEVDGSKIEDSRDLARKIADIAPKTVVEVKVWRRSAEETIKVTLGTFPSSVEAALKPEREEESEEPAPAVTTDLKQLGITLTQDPSGSTTGVAIAEVDPQSDAALKGIKAGDVILEAGGETVSKPEDVVAAVKKIMDLGRPAVMLHLKTGDQNRLVPVQINKS